MKMLKNAVYNFAGYAAAMALSIVSVPILLSYIGEARYGIMILTAMLSGFLVFFDFGLGQAIRYDIARRTSDEEKVDVFWTATLLLAEVIPFLAIFYLVTDRYGLSGAVLVVLARGLADFALLSWFAGLLGKFALTMLQALALCGAAYATEMSLPLETLTGIATRLLLVAITLGWALWQSADLRKLVAVTLEKLRLILFARGA